MKQPKYYVLKEWVIRCALALIATLFSDYSAESGYIFVRLTCPQTTSLNSVVVSRA